MDGSIRSYLKSWNNKDFSGIIEKEYLICYNENKKQTLINGKGIFLASDKSKDIKYIRRIK
ncbi:hypothetical protein B4N84_19620 [Flavobacterium sp. IR1]|nr:hypothetical protein B4N84_19620 [Flavobacterium sp. IR1]